MVPESDPGDHQRVDLVGFGVGTALAAKAGGELGWHLPNVQTGNRGWATVCAGSLNRHPGCTTGLCPGNQLTVTGRGVMDGLVLQGGAQVVHQRGRKGILVRVDPDNQHRFLQSSNRRIVRERQKARRSASMR